ncbi:hypothetical protein J7L05_00480 [bacterium]|nr:hypothetical protein [bacterium]
MIKLLKKNQEIQIRFGKLKNGKDKVELLNQNEVIGRLKYDAVKSLLLDIGHDPKRIIRVEAAQIILTDTEPDKRKYNDDQDMHYYIIPRIFYRKNQ